MTVNKLKVLIYIFISFGLGLIIDLPNNKINSLESIAYWIAGGLGYMFGSFLIGIIIILIISLFDKSFRKKIPSAASFVMMIILILLTFQNLFFNYIER